MSEENSNTSLEVDLTVPDDFSLEPTDNRRIPDSPPRIDLTCSEKQSNINSMVETQVFLQSLDSCSEEMKEIFEDIITEDKAEENKRYEKFIKEKSYNSLKKANPQYMSKKEVSIFRRRAHKYYEAEIKNGFYTGFIAHFRCQCCDAVLGEHVSPYKRIYWVHPKKCCFCAGLKAPMAHKEAFLANEDAKKWSKRCKGKGYIFKPAEHFFIHDF